MSQELKALNDRIIALKAQDTHLKLALEYISSDPHSSLTNSRIVLEKMLHALYQILMKEDPPQSMIGPMLKDKNFTSMIPPRIVYRMNAIREMSNLGPHGGEVNEADAIRVMRDLVDVLEWYVTTYPPEFDELIKAQIEIMKGYPLAYIEGMHYSELETMMAQAMNISSYSDSQWEVAFRYSFPQFLDWLQSQTKNPENTSG
jgi:hypothetical protein